MPTCTCVPRGCQAGESTRFCKIEVQIGTKPNRPLGRASACDSTRQGSFNRTVLARNLFVQFVVMAGTFVLIEIGTEWLIASLAHRIKPWLQRVGRRFNQVCGALFAAIGVALPLRG